MEERMKRRKGYKVMGGDLNFVMDTKWDKTGDRANLKRGMRGKKEQTSWERMMGVKDIWRERDPGVMRWTGEERGRRDDKKIKTRIDRWLIDERLEIQGRIGEVEIEKTRESDHNMITLEMRVDDTKQERSVVKIPVIMIENEEYGKEVRSIFEEETKKEGDILEIHEVMKEKFREAAIARVVKQRKKKKRDKYKVRKEIKGMRRIVNWIEDAIIQVERKKKIKRWEYGNKLLREARVEKWIGKKLNEVGLDELQSKAERRLQEMMRRRDDEDERAKRLKKNLDKMEEIDKDEKGTRFFYQKVRMENKKEIIDTLVEEKDSESEGEERVMNETSKPEEMKEIARRFYERFWRKRTVNNRQLTNLLKGVRRKLNEAQKESCEGEITIEELRETKKSMKKGKTGGVDGIPAEFWLKFDMDEWLVKVFNETI